MNKQTTFKIVSVLLSTILTLVFVLTAYSYIIISTYSGKMVVETLGDFTIQDDTEIGFIAPKNGITFRKHVDSGLQYHLYTDSRGARVDSAHQPSLSNTNIVTIGCSFSWGHGIENKNTYSSLIKKKTNLGVVNLALGSYGTVQSLLLLKRNLDLKPQVVIYGFILDHIRRNLTPCAPNYSPLCLSSPYVGFDDLSMPYIHPPLYANMVKVNRDFYMETTNSGFQISHLKWGFNIIWSRLCRPEVKIDSIQRYSSTKFLINDLYKTVNSIRAKLIIVFIPTLNRDLTPAPPDELMQALHKDIIFIDMSPIFKSYYNSHSNSLRFDKDSHPNEIAHNLIADEVLRVLIERQLIINQINGNYAND